MSTTWSLSTLKASNLVKWLHSRDRSCGGRCQFIDWLKFETSPSWFVGQKLTGFSLLPAFSSVSKLFASHDIVHWINAKRYNGEREVWNVRKTLSGPISKVSETKFKTQTCRRRTSWLLINVTEKLNSGLPSWSPHQIGHTASVLTRSWSREKSLCKYRHWCRAHDNNSNTTPRSKLRSSSSFFDHNLKKKKEKTNFLTTGPVPLMLLVPEYKVSSISLAFK